MTRVPETPITYSGRIYAVSDRHKEFYIEDTDGQRFIIQPEQWDNAQYERLLRERVTVYARGIDIVGLPVVGRAVVKWINWDDSEVQHGA